MRLQSVLVTALAALAVFSACSKKNDDNSGSDKNARTVANFSGTYTLDSLTASAFGQTANLKDSIPECQKDDQVILKADLTVDYSDGTVKCSPTTDSSGTWHLSANADSIYIGDQGEYIKSWDGSTLVLTGTQEVTTGITATTMAIFKKQ